jgi:uncharacterized protein (UPF0332 family)
MIKLSVKFRKEWSKNNFIAKVKARRLKNIVKLKSTMTSMTLIERSEEQVLFVSGEESIVYGISKETHE